MTIDLAQRIRTQVQPMFKPLALIRVGICKDCNKTKTNKMIWESVARLFGGVGLILLMGLLGRHADNSGTGVFGAFGLFGLIMSLRGAGYQTDRCQGNQEKHCHYGGDDGDAETGMDRVRSVLGKIESSYKKREPFLCHEGSL